MAELRLTLQVFVIEHKPLPKCTTDLFFGTHLGEHPEVKIRLIVRGSLGSNNSRSTYRARMMWAVCLEKAKPIASTEGSPKLSRKFFDLAFVQALKHLPSPNKYFSVFQNLNRWAKSWCPQEGYPVPEGTLSVFSLAS